MANNFAYISIVSWPLIMFLLFKVFSIQKAVLLSMIGSYLFLPASFEINFTGLPALNKNTVTTIMLCLILFFKKEGIGFNELDKKTFFVFLLFLLSPFITASLNSEHYMHLPGVTLYDGLAQSVSAFLIIVPFLVGARYFNTFTSQKMLFTFLIVACLVYIPFMLFELRMSPQIHRIVYGYFPHSFIQQVRFDGYRPVVFLGHGLLVAMFVAVSLIALLTAIRAKVNIIGSKQLYIFFLMSIMLILTKTYGALLLFIFAATCIYLFKFRNISIISMCILVLYISYPLMSANKIFPHETVTSMVAKVSSERAQSLEFRFFHENQLLAHANEKPIFGWSSWGRNRVYDPETFQDLSVTDGRWIITLGIRGWFGFLTEFYFVFISIWWASKITRIRSQLTSEQNMFISGHLLIVTIILIDQIPNASLSFFYWLIIGSLYGLTKKEYNSKTFVR
ncbi:hypothetical protein [Nitrincola schmidtii]|uniref:hypothetical protein n=1 Tax=Nitrincola schmidtii TaxID=1730894 RepID=UPI00124C3AC3|nr:hypothetical protein [Nitrincola schmidtii]